MENNYFAITTFGTPAKRYRRVHDDQDAAKEQAAELKGSGSCSAVHVLGFSTRAQARDADISDHRGLGVVGETIAVY